MMINLNKNNIDLKEEIESGLKYETDNKNINIYLEFSEEHNNVVFNHDLVKKYIEEINALYPNINFKFKFVYRMKENYVLDTNNCKELEKIDNYLRDNYQSELYIREKNASFSMYGFRKTLTANRKLDSIANNIKNASNNGAPLSNFEKFMLAYEYVTNYVYNEGGDLLHSTTSHWVPVIEGDKIVCAGYASLLSALCDRIFSPNDVKVLEQGLSVFNKNSDEYIGGHGNNIIFIKDEKYGIDGLFYVDSCWDSIKDDRKDKPQAYCCIPLKDILHNKKYSFDFGDMSEGLTHFYLSQDKEYRDSYEKRKLKKQSEISKIEFLEEEKKFFANTHKIDTIEEEIEKYLFGYQSHKKDVEYYKNYVSDVIEYNIDGYSILDFSNKLLEYRENLEEKMKKDFNDVFEKYSDIDIPNYLPESLIEYYKLQQHLDNLSSREYDVVKLKESLVAFGEAFSDQKAKKFVQMMINDGIGSQSLKSFAELYVVDGMENRKRSEMIEKQEKIAKEGKIKNATNLINHINEKANCDSVPIQAFLNSYKIIGKMKDLEGEELKQYVKNRIIKSIERTNECFDTTKCDNCFAKTKVEDIERGVIKKI